MSSQIVQVNLKQWQAARFDSALAFALEEGKVLHFPNLVFQLNTTEQCLFNPSLLAKGSRNISLGVDGVLKGATADALTFAALHSMLARFKQKTQQLIEGLMPAYAQHLRYAPTSYRPVKVDNRFQSWRADDKRLHVDAFPSRPNRGERILRVFANINPHGEPRVWRVGEPFEAVAQQFIPKSKPYIPWQAKLLKVLRVTKSFRSEYDHIMLQLHDNMKFDQAYQSHAVQEKVLFYPGSVWVCFSDQTTHAAMSGQFMLEQTLHLDVSKQYQPSLSPLHVLQKLTNRLLVANASMF
jgi:3-deoxy-D-manno-oct-2-ulosonic acid (Kdo) hydroxylase